MHRSFTFNYSLIMSHQANQRLRQWHSVNAVTPAKAGVHPWDAADLTMDSGIDRNEA